MRQWYKLQKAYEMMAAFEEEVGKNFDLVLKLRTPLPFAVQVSYNSLPFSSSLYSQNSFSNVPLRDYELADWSSLFYTLVLFRM